MAMVQCPECKKEISEKAYTCPHCGYPVRPLPKDETRYMLRVGDEPSESGLVSALRVLAVLTWIGGVIIAIVGGHTMGSLASAFGGRYGSDFSFSQFLVTLAPFAVDGFLLFCLAEVVDRTARMYEMIKYTQLKVETVNQDPQAVKNAPRAYHTVKNVGSEWICPQCGKRNPSSAIQCSDCGKYK